MELPDTSQSHLVWSLEKPLANVKCVSCNLVQNDKTGVRVWTNIQNGFIQKNARNLGVFSCLQDSFAACPWRRPRSPATAGRAALIKGLGRELGTVGEAEIN